MEGREYERIKILRVREEGERVRGKGKERQEGDKEAGREGRRGRETRQEEEREESREEEGEKEEKRRRKRRG